MDALARSALAGAATGLRTSAGLGMLIEAGEPGLPGPLRTERARAAAAIGILGELVIDKLPQTPSRLQAGGRFGRLAAAAAAGAAIARGSEQPVLRSAAVAAGAALLAARIGHDLRVARPGIGAAVVEDAVALSLASNAA